MMNLKHSFSVLLALFFVNIALSGCNSHTSRHQSDEYATLATTDDSAYVTDPDIQSEQLSSTSATDDAEADASLTKADGIEIPSPLTDRPEIILQRAGYTVSYNKELMLPNWVAWHLTATKTDGTAERKGIKFEEDTDVPSPRADTHDYVRSGYDRGHMCPAGDNKWSQEAMEQSFLMTNICPQDPGLNRGDWNEMEKQCRVWAERYGDIYIVAGPILYNQTHTTIGKHHVVVPEAFFKVVLCLQGTPKAIGFIYKNRDGDRPKGDYVNSIKDIERITGIHFFPNLPAKTRQAIEAHQDLSQW